MSPQDVVIDLKGITKRYGIGDAESYALKDFDLTVKRGEFIMIMGPSGCGKTTLLNIIGLLDRPTEGEYLLNGESVERVSDKRKARLRAKKIGVIFQDFNLVPQLTVLDNVTLPMVYAGYSKTHRELQADRILERFRLQEREYYMPYQLSGGQQQRVAIARSLVVSPEIILADEPTGNLDSRSSHIVMEELREIHSEGNTIIMVTHNPNLTAYATRVINMLDGQIDTDIKTVADKDLPQPVAVHFRKRHILKEVKEAIKGSSDGQEKEADTEKEIEEKRGIDEEREVDEGRGIGEEEEVSSEHEADDDISDEKTDKVENEREEKEEEKSEDLGKEEKEEKEAKEESSPEEKEPEKSKSNSQKKVKKAAKKKSKQKTKRKKQRK